MERGFKYRIYPNRAQQELIAKTFGCCRFVYNTTLSKCKEVYNTEKVSMSRTDCNNWCNRELKAQYEWLKDVDKFALTNAVYNMDSAYQKFFREHAGYPRFKSKHDSRQSYKTNTTNGNIAADFDCGFVKLPKLGKIKARLHRKFEGKIKNATISRTSSGNYYVAFCVDAPQPEFKATKGIVGLDLGIKNLCITSDGDKYDGRNTRPLEDRISLLQKGLSRKTKGSSNYKKQKIRIAILHEHISNIRKDNLHKLSRKIVDENQIIVTETLNVKGMMHRNNFARNIANASWGY